MELQRTQVSAPGQGVEWARRRTVDSVEYVSKRGGHLPLKVLVKLLAEAVDAGPIQFLV